MLIFICTNRDTQLAYDRFLEPLNENQMIFAIGVFSAPSGWGGGKLPFCGDELVSLRIGEYQRIGPPPQRGEILSRLVGHLSDKLKEVPS